MEQVARARVLLLKYNCGCLFKRAAWSRGSSKLFRLIYHSVQKSSPLITFEDINASVFLHFFYVLWNVRPFYLSLILCNRKCYFRKRDEVSLVCCCVLEHCKWKPKARSTLREGVFLYSLEDVHRRWAWSGWVGRYENKFFSVMIIFPFYSFEVYSCAVRQYYVLI